MLHRLLAALLVFPLVAGCESAPPAEAERSFTDGAGRSVRLSAEVEQVVSLAPNLTELVFAAGAGERLVAVSTADDFPPAVGGLPRIGALPVDFEAVAALEPDLVLATTQVNNLQDAATFESLGIPVYFFSFDEVGDVFSGLRRLGVLLGTPERADLAADSLEGSMEALERRMEGLDERPTVLFLIDSEALFTFGDESYVHDLVRRAGGLSQTRDFEGEGVTLSEEFVLLNPPDVILGTFSAPDPLAHVRSLQPEWASLPVVRDGRVYSVDPDLVYRAGPRLVEGAWRIAAHLHPERVAGRDTVEKAP